MLKRLVCWLWSLLHDKRFLANVGISLVLGAVNFWLLIHLVSQKGYNSFLTNLALGLSWAIIWYPINRFILFRSRSSEISSSARRSFIWWLTTFVLHQLAFNSAVGLIGLPLIAVKTVLSLVGLVEFVLNFWFKDKFAFRRKLSRVTVKA